MCPLLLLNNIVKLSVFGTWIEHLLSDVMCIENTIAWLRLSYSALRHMTGRLHWQMCPQRRCYLGQSRKLVYRIGLFSSHGFWLHFSVWLLWSHFNLLWPLLIDKHLTACYSWACLYLGNHWLELSLGAVNLLKTSRYHPPEGQPSDLHLEICRKRFPQSVSWWNLYLREHYNENMLFFQV